MTMREKTTAFLAALLLLCSSAVNLSAGEQRTRCKEAERQALLRFKAGLDDPEHGGVLSSWDPKKTECCEWLGVQCDGKSGHVVWLDLSPSTLNWSDFGGTPPLTGGSMSSSLLELPYLSYLDLSHISFYETKSFPGFVGQISELRYLNLSYTTITGEVSPRLGNLSNLRVLDLSDTFKWRKTITDISWVSRLSSLRVLDLSFVDIVVSAKIWMSVVSNNLPNLSKLSLASSGLRDSAPLSEFNSSSKLSYIDLSGNSLSGSIFEWLFGYSQTLVHLDVNSCFMRSSIPDGLERMASLEYLDLGANLLVGSIPSSIGSLTKISFLNLGNNQLLGNIPESLGKMTKLEYLDLGANMLEGEIPKSIWEICTLRNFRAHNNNLSGQLRFSDSSSKCGNFSLEFLNLEQNRISGPLYSLSLYPNLTSIWLQSNQLNGSVSKNLGQLSRLETLDLSKNSIETVITEAHFLELFKLRYLDLSSNDCIVFKISSDFVPPFQLDYILLESCKVGPGFPKWLRNQKSYGVIDISNSGISDSIPNWFWNLSNTAGSLNLSNNQIRGTNQNDDPRFQVSYFNLSSPLLIPSTIVDLSSNRLQGSVPMFLLNMSSELRLSRNKFSDLNSLCKTKTAFSLRFLDLSNNRLFGKLPDCWLNTPNMGSLILSRNNLSGKIPSSIGFMDQISELNLSNNKFAGELPSSLSNCTQLAVFDVGENELSGKIPEWIGTNLKNLEILILRLNRFSGSVPSQLCQLEHIQVLDLSSNNFSGSIPKCVKV